MNDTRRADGVEPAAGYLDDEFARFRAERLAKRAASRGQGGATETAAPAAPPTVAEPPPEPPPGPPPEPTVAPQPVAEAALEPPAPAANEPREGYLEDDFARFRTERLRTKSGRLTRPPEGEDGMFFGTSSNERRLNRIVSEAAREDVSDLPPPATSDVVGEPADPAEPRQAG